MMVRGGGGAQDGEGKYVFDTFTGTPRQTNRVTNRDNRIQNWLGKTNQNINDIFSGRTKMVWVP